MRQMSIPDLAQKLDQAESTFGQVHPQVRPPAEQPRILPVNLCTPYRLIDLVGQCRVQYSTTVSIQWQNFIDGQESHHIDFPLCLGCALWMKLSQRLGRTPYSAILRGKKSMTPKQDA